MKIFNYQSFVYFILITLVVSHPGYGQIRSFEETLKIAKMQFKLPEGCVELTPVANKSMLYSYSYQDTSAKFEVRYRIDPITEENKSLESPQSRVTTALAVMYNISDKSVPIPELAKRIAKVPPEMTKNEYNADDAMMSGQKITDDFSKEYTDSFVVYIHKAGVANVWLFVLLNNKEELKNALQRGVMSALKFVE